MCKKLGELTNLADYVEELQRIAATAYLMTQLLRVASPELRALQEKLMLAFAATNDDGGGDGVLALIDQLSEGCKAKLQDRNDVIRSALGMEAY